MRSLSRLAKSQKFRELQQVKKKSSKNNSLQNLNAIQVESVAKACHKLIIFGGRTN